MGYSRKNPHPPDGWDSGNSRGRGGGSKTLEIQAGGGFGLEKSLLQGSFRPTVRAIRTVCSVTLQRSQTLKIVEIFCSHISHLT